MTPEVLTAAILKGEITLNQVAKSLAEGLRHHAANLVAVAEQRMWILLESNERDTYMAAGRFENDADTLENMAKNIGANQLANELDTPEKSAP